MGFAVLNRCRLAVCLSVRLVCHAFVYYVKTSNHILEAFSPSGIATQHTSFSVANSLSLTGTLDRPRVVYSALQDLRSYAISQASLTTWRWAQCRPRSAAPTFGRVVHAGGSTPAWCPIYRLHVSTARRSVEWAGVASCSRRTWPKMESRLWQIRIAKPSSAVWLVTEAFMAIV